MAKDVKPHPLTNMASPTRLAIDLVLDTALSGLGCRDIEDDRMRCEAIRETAALFGFQNIVERANRWLSS